MSNDFDNDFPWSDNDDDNELPDFEENDEFDWSELTDDDDDDQTDQRDSDADDDFDWLSQQDDDDYSSGDEADSDENLDWLTDSDSEEDSSDSRQSDRLGVTGELSWLQSSSDEDGDDRRPDENKTGVTGELSWRESEQRASDFESLLDEAEQSATNQRDEDDASGIDLFAGMDDDFDDEEEVEDSDDAIPDWLRDVEPEEEDEEVAARQAINTDELFADFDTEFDEEEEQHEIPTTGELPDWIDDDSRVLDETSPEWVKDIKQTIGTGELEDESVEVDTPDWLSEVQPEEEPEEVTFEADDISSEEDLELEEDLVSLFEVEEMSDLPDEDEEGLSDLLNVLEDDDDDFDLLGELSADAGDDDLLSLLEESEEDDFDLLDQLEDSPEIPQQSAESADETLEAFDFGMDFEADETMLESEGDEEDIDLLDASWLDDVDIEPEAAQQADADVVTDFLSSIDDEISYSSALAADDSDVDFDTLFADDSAFEDLAEDDQVEDDATSDEDLAERPDWLQNVTVGDISASAIVRRQQDRPLEELPDRLQALHDAGVELGTASAALSVSDAIISTDDVATSVSEENEVTSVLQVSPEQVEKTNILRNITGVVPSTVQSSEAKREQRFKTGFNFPAVSVAILIFFAVAFPFIMGYLRLGNTPAEQFPVDSLQNSMFNNIESLSADDKVLFALEYGPTGAPELDDATSILALHVMSKNAVPIVVSTNPVGLLHGNVVIDDIASNPTLIALRNQPIANQDYFVSRYITAENIGLRSFSDPTNLQSILSENIDGDEIDTGITSLDDFTYIVVIAESADSVRNWSEQIGSVTNTPLLFATGFAAAPLARPYVEAGDNNGFIYGLGDFLTYVDQFNATLSGEFALPPSTEEPTETETIEVAPTGTPTTDTTSEPETDVEFTPTLSATEQLTEAPTETEVPTDTATPEPQDTIEPSETPTDTIDAATVTPSPEPTEPPTPTATATVQEGGLFDLYGIVAANQPVNVRGGPGTSFTVVGLLQPNERVRILGENADGTWYQVELEGVEEAWIAAFLITLEINPGDSSYMPGNPYIIGRNSNHIAQNDTEVTTANQESEIPEYNIDNGELRWYGITFGLIVIVLIIIVGNLIGIIRDTNQRGK